MEVFFIEDGKMERAMFLEVIMNARTIPSSPLCLRLRLCWIFRTFGLEGLGRMDKSKRSKGQEEEHIDGELVLSIEKLQEI